MGSTANPYAALRQEQIIKEMQVGGALAEHAIKDMVSRCPYYI